MLPAPEYCSVFCGFPAPACASVTRSFVKSPQRPHFECAVASQTHPRLEGSDTLWLAFRQAHLGHCCEVDCEEERVQGTSQEAVAVLQVTADGC